MGKKTSWMPSGGGISKNEMIWRVVAVVSVVLLVLGTVAMFIFNDKNITIPEVVMLTTAVVGLLGLTAKSLRDKGSGSGGPPIAGALLIVMSLFTTVN